MSHEYAIEPFDSEAPEAVDNSSETVLVRLESRFGLKRAAAMELVDEVVEAFSSRGAVGDGADIVRQLTEKHRRLMHLLVGYQARQKTPEEIRMSTRVMALELGYSTVAGADNVAELARLTGFKKQTVNKAALNFQTKGGLPPRSGQRDEAARANMSEQRKAQLKTKPNQP